MRCSTRKRWHDAVMKTVFVSSTFKDMNAERDLIHERVAPLLNGTAGHYGDHVSFCDLRWGVNTMDMDDETASRKVLNFCLDEIDRCRPYMVVFIGYRYGWIPDAGMLAEELRGRDLVLEDLERSVTELEIEYGALSHPEGLSHVLFYFRNIEGNPPADYQSEDEAHERKLQELKSRIRALTGGRIREYTVRWDEESGRLAGMEDLLPLLLEDLTGVFAEEWKAQESLSDLEKTLRGQFEYARQKSFPVSRRTGLINECLELSRTERIVCLKGDSGSGKTAVMSGLVETLRAQGADVLPVFCGTTKETNDAYDLLSLTVRFLQNRLGLPEDTEAETVEELRGRMLDLGTQYSDTCGRELYLVFDALDQLFPDELRGSMNFVIQQPEKHIHYILSALTDHPVNVRNAMIRVPELGREEKKAIIRGLLADAGRELDESVTEAAASREASSNPFYLGLLILRLLMLRGSDFEAIRAQGDGMESISRYQRKLVEAFPGTLEEAIPELIRAASERIGGQMAERTVAYLALSRSGLRQEEIFALLEKEGLAPSGLDLSMFMQYLSDFFLVRDDGRYDLTHGKIREAVLASLGDGKDACLQNLFEVMDALPAGDAVRTMELGFQAIRADRKESLIALCTDRTQPEARAAAARDLAEQSLADDGQYAVTLIGESIRSGNSQGFAAFIATTLADAFGVSRREAAVSRRILEAVSGVLPPDSLIQAELKMRAADCCVILSGKDMMAQAREKYARAKAVFERALASPDLTQADFVRQRYIRLLSRAADNDVRDGHQDTARDLAQEGIRLSEQYGMYDDVIALYYSAVASGYYIGVQKKFFEKKPLFGRKKTVPELEEAARMAEKGDARIGEFYRKGRLTENGTLRYARFKKLYGDVLEALLEKDGLDRMRVLYREAADIGLAGRNAWSLEGAALREEVYGALYTGILDGDDWTDLKEATSYAEKALDAGLYRYRRLGTVEARLKLIGDMNAVSRVYLAAKSEPEEGFLKGYLVLAFDMSRQLAEEHEEKMGSGIVACLAQSAALLGTFQMLFGEMAGLKLLRNARKLLPPTVKAEQQFLQKAWKKQGIVLKPLPESMLEV